MKHSMGEWVNAVAFIVFILTCFVAFFASIIGIGYTVVTDRFEPVPDPKPYVIGYPIGNPERMEQDPRSWVIGPWNSTEQCDQWADAETHMMGIIASANNEPVYAEFRCEILDNHPDAVVQESWITKFVIIVMLLLVFVFTGKIAILTVEVILTGKA